MDPITAVLLGLPLLVGGLGFAHYMGWIALTRLAHVLGFVLFALISHLVILVLAPDLWGQISGVFAMLVAGAAILWLTYSRQNGDGVEQRAMGYILESAIVWTGIVLLLAGFYGTFAHAAWNSQAGQNVRTWYEEFRTETMKSIKTHFKKN